MTEATPAHRVAVVGSGFGGLFATRFLRRAPAAVRLIDRTNHHLFQPLLYQVATGILSEGQIAPATRDILHRQKNLTVEVGEVTGFDLEQRLVLTARPDRRSDPVPFDSLVVAAGAGPSYFGHDEYRQFAPGIKTLADALALRMRIFGALERAELEEDPRLRAEWLTFVAVGGGPTGVEISGQIAELSLAPDRNFRRFDPREIRVLLFDGGDEILASFGDRLSGRGTRELEKTGVEIQTRSIVVGVDERGVDVKGADGTVTRYPARTKIWAADVAASPLARLLADATGAECDRAGRIQVEPDCSIAGHPNVFAVGDMMALDGLPGVAEVALQSGIHAARTIARGLEGKEPEPFRYRDLASMAAIARRRAIVSFRVLRLSGSLGWLMWLVVHLTFMAGFKNRFLTIFYWLFSFIGHGRTERALLPTVVDGPEAGLPATLPTLTRSAT